MEMVLLPPASLSIRQNVSVGKRRCTKPSKAQSPLFLTIALPRHWHCRSRLDFWRCTSLIAVLAVLFLVAAAVEVVQDEARIGDISLKVAPGHCPDVRGTHAGEKLTRVVSSLLQQWVLGLYNSAQVFGSGRFSFFSSASRVLAVRQSMRSGELRRTEVEILQRALRLYERRALQLNEVFLERQQLHTGLQRCQDMFRMAKKSLSLVELFRCGVEHDSSAAAKHSDTEMLLDCMHRRWHVVVQQHESPCHHTTPGAAPMKALPVCTRSYANMPVRRCEFIVLQLSITYREMPVWSDTRHIRWISRTRAIWNREHSVIVTHGYEIQQLACSVAGGPSLKLTICIRSHLAGPAEDYRCRALRWSLTYLVRSACLRHTLAKSEMDLMGVISNCVSKMPNQQIRRSKKALLSAIGKPVKACLVSRLGTNDTKRDVAGPFFASGVSSWIASVRGYQLRRNSLEINRTMCQRSELVSVFTNCKVYASAWHDAGEVPLPTCEPNQNWCVLEFGLAVEELDMLNAGAGNTPLKETETRHRLSLCVSTRLESSTPHRLKPDMIHETRESGRGHNGPTFATSNQATTSGHRILCCLLAEIFVQTFLIVLIVLIVCGLAVVRHRKHVNGRANTRVGFVQSSRTAWSHCRSLRSGLESKTHCCPPPPPPPTSAEGSITLETVCEKKLNSPRVKLLPSTARRKEPAGIQVKPSTAYQTIKCAVSALFPRCYTVELTNGRWQPMHMCLPFGRTEALPRQEKTDACSPCSSDSSAKRSVSKRDRVGDQAATRGNGSNRWKFDSGMHTRHGPGMPSITVKMVENHCFPMPCSRSAPVSGIPRYDVNEKESILRPRQLEELGYTCRGDRKDHQSTASAEPIPTAGTNGSSTDKKSDAERNQTARSSVQDESSKNLVRKRRLLFNALSMSIVNQLGDAKSCLTAVLNELVNLTNEQERLRSYRPQEDAEVLSMPSLAIVLMSIAKDLSLAAQSNATVGNRDVVQEAACTTGVTSELMQTSDMSSLDAVLKGVGRQFNAKYQDVIKCLYQLGLAHMRVSLSKASHSGQASSEEVHLHSKKACEYMRHIVSATRGDSALYYSARLTIAQCETILQRYADSLQSYEDILAELSSDNSSDAMFYTCETHLGRGEIKLRTRDPQKALSIFQKAFDVGKELRVERDRDNIMMKALNKIAACYRDLNKMDLSVRSYTEALEYAESIMHEVGISTVAGALGSIYESMGNPSKASVYFSKQYESAVRTSDYSMISLAAGNLGNALVQQNDLSDLPKAKDLLNIALTRAEQVGNMSEVGRATCSIGNMLYVEKNYAEALKMFRKACQLSIEYMDRVGQQRACSNIGNVYMALEQPSLARDWYELARNLSPQVADASTEANTSYNVGCCYLSLHLNEPGSEAGQRYLLQAEENFHNAVSLYEDMLACIGSSSYSDLLKLSLFQGYARAFRQLQFIYCTRGQHEVALEMAERSHGMTFPDMSMHQLDNQTETAQAIPTPLSSAEISMHAQQQTSTVLIYSVCHDQLQTWVVDPRTGQITFRCKVVNPTQQLISSSTATDKILHAQVSDAMDSVSSLNDIDSSYTNDIGVSIGLGRLFDVLVGHVNDLLPKPFIGEELVIVPCSALAGASFAALFDTKSGLYLSQMYAVRILPTCRMLGKPAELPIKRVFQPDGTANELEDTRQFDVLAVGNPDIPELEVGGKKWTPPKLPYAHREAVNVAQHFGCKPLLAEDAHKDAVLAELPHARLVHFATHGLDSESCLLVSQSQSSTATSGDELLRDCSITAADLETIQMKADLVVLSSCHSSSSSNMEGLMGLGRAFLLAGAQAVIVGLWDIPDEATELLMRCFYNLARQKGWTSSSAMQHAMHQVRCFDRFALPRYWAGFEIMGRQVILNFERPLKDYNTYWDAVVPRSLTQQQALPCLHLNIFNDVIQWLHSPTSSTGMLINGPAATGKTVLATQIAKYFTYAFVESHVVWLDFSNAASLRQSAQLALKQWHEVNSLPSSTAASAPYAFAMATGSGGGGSDDSSSKNSLAQLLQAMGQSSFAYLLILDGLDELSLLQCSTEVMSFISNSVVGALPPRLLATSRSPLLIDMGDLCDFHQVTTSLLSSEDSLLAMLQLTAEANPSPMLNECDAYHLSELCQKYLSGGYPLMADQLADRVGLYPSCSFTTLKQSLDKAAGAAAA
eukprot:scpid7344/ scgid4851/ Tetratricopeptide repeat protein 28